MRILSVLALTFGLLAMITGAWSLISRKHYPQVRLTVARVDKALEHLARAESLCQRMSPDLDTDLPDENRRELIRREISYARIWLGEDSPRQVDYRYPYSATEGG